MWCLWSNWNFTLRIKISPFLLIFQIFPGNAYPSGHLVPSRFGGLACAPIVETRFLELAMSLIDFSPWIPLGTFLILLPIIYAEVCDSKSPYCDIKHTVTVMCNIPSTYLVITKRCHVVIQVIFAYLLITIMLGPRSILSEFPPFMINILTW